MKAVTTLLFLLFHLNGFTQHQERTVFVYNAAFGGITAGVGAAINKQKDVNWKKAFLKGFWQGSIAGVLNYSGKKTLYLVNRNQNYIYAWPAKLLHAASNSIRENAALNEPFLQNWNIDFGPLRFDFSLKHKRNFKARLLPEAIFAIAAGATYGKLDLMATLSTGQIIFYSKDILNVPNVPVSSGITFGRSSIYVVDNVPNSLNKFRVIAHELVHQFQYSEYLVFNTWLKPFEKKIKSKSLKSIFSKYIYLDIPYFFAAYYINGRYADPHYYRNFYEFEADRFATNEYVPR